MRNVSENDKDKSVQKEPLGRSSIVQTHDISERNRSIPSTGRSQHRAVQPNRHGRTHRMVLLGFWILLLGACFGRTISNQELQETFKPFFETSHDSVRWRALADAEKVAFGVSRGSLREMRTHGISERNRKMLHLLRVLRYEVSWGLTDAALQGMTKTGVFGQMSKLDSEIDNLFDSELVTRDLSVIGQLAPDEALSFVEFVCRAWVVRNGPLPQGARDTTWAAQDLAAAVPELKLSRLAARSAFVKLLIEDGALTMPTQTIIRLRWSGGAIRIDLPPIVWSNADVAEIESVAHREWVTSYADALSRARAQVQ